MRIAITGAAGYIGGWLRVALQARGHLIFAQDRHQIPKTGHCSFDLANDRHRRDWLDDHHPDAVVHLAALYGRVWGEADLVDTIGMNAGVTAELARDLDERGIPLMFVSSSEVYGRSATAGPVSELSPLEPLNTYGLSKKWGEEACALYAPDGLMIARLNMPYGPPKDKPKVGTRPPTSGIPGPLGYNVIHSMVWQAEHGMPLRVHAGTERCLTWVGDAVRGLAVILEAGRPGTWNVCRNDDHRQVAELAKLVLDVTGSNSEIIEEEPPRGVTMSKSLENDRLLSLGWEPSVDLEDGVRRCWEFFRRYGEDGTWHG